MGHSNINYLRNNFKVLRKDRYDEINVFWIERDKISISQLSEWTKGGTPWKWILGIFKCKNEFLKQLGLEKQMKKARLFVWSLNCQKLRPFCTFLLMLGKIKAVIEIYIYPFESSRFALSENGIGCYAMTLEFRGFQRLMLMNFVKFLLSQHFFGIFLLNIFMDCCSDPYKHYFLKEHDVLQMDINKLL